MRHELSNSLINIDIIAIQETWFKFNTNLSIENFKGPITKSRTDSRGGGIAFYVSNKLEYEVIHNMSFTEKAIETLTIKINHKSKSHILVCLYRPPKHNLINLFYERLDQLISFSKNSFPTSILDILGDYNLNTFDPKIRDKFYEISMSNGLLPTVTKPTRITATTKTLIDNILTSNTHNLGTYVIRTNISDHFSVLLSRQVKKKEKSTETQYTRLINNKSIICFKEKLANINWNEIYELDEVEEIGDFFLDTLQKNFNTSFPLTKSKVKKGQISPIYFTKGIRESIKKEKKLYNKKLSSKTEYHKQKHREYKKMLDKLKRKAKQEYYHTNLKNANNPKKTWEIINSLTGRTKGKNELSDQFIIDGHHTKDTKDIANGFNDFFKNVGPNLSKKFPAITNYEKFLTKHSTSFSFHLINENELIEAMSRLKPKSSSGPDGIPTKIIKSCIVELIHPLRYFINQSLSKGHFHSRLKEALIIPLYKNEEKDKFTNHRPISLLNSISKIFEKIVHIQVYKYLSINKILSENQFGFRSKHSTEHALFKFVNDLQTQTNKKKLTAAVFIDLSKAFDTVDSTILLKKLNYLGFQENELNFFKSYLTNRTQRTKFNDTLSDLLITECGVPQGSILGPLLFIIYINDFSNNIKTDSTIFADDTTLICSGKNKDDLKSNIVSNLIDAETWFSANKLSLNLKKTKIIFFHPKKGNTPNNIKMNDINIESIGEHREKEIDKYVKFLGFKIDDELSFKYHIKEIINKTTKGTYALATLKYTIPKKSKLMIYHSLIASHLFYGLSIWSNCGIKKLIKIEKLQKKAIRNIAAAKYNEHTERIFKNLKILRFKDQATVNTSKLMHSIKYQYAPRALINMFCNEPVNKRHDQNNLPESFFPADITLNKMPRVWNSLNSTYKAISSPKYFKTSLFSSFISEYKEESNCTKDCYTCNHITQ